MYYIKYYLIRKSDKETFNVDMKQDNLPFVIVGTTRPETILGDSAICINPNDKRFYNIDYIFDNYQKFNEEISKIRNKKNVNIDKLKKDLNETLKLERSNKYKLDKMCNIDETCETETGLMAINPLTNKLIPVIKDAHADLNLGTGVLKITPSHDNIDFKLSIKHNLEFIRMMDKHNKIDFEGSEYHGMSRFEARKLIVSYHSCVYSQENYDQILPFCSRSNDIVEPMIKEQWWMNCKSMAKKALDAVKNGEIKMYPEEAKSTWYRWLENIKDWCLSRQLWWGHKIPAYYYFNEKNEKCWIVSDNKNEVVKKMELGNGTSLTQDEDVLDTWFSSGLWPFSTLGWGWNDNSQLFKKYFPNSMLETGSDILFFWIARMVMLSYELIGSKPFDKILLHGIVRDAHGKKMSKSLGNVIDPIFVIEGISKEELIKNISINASADEKKRAEMSIIKDYPNGIPKCGSDALRFALLSYANGMKDINLDVLRVAGYSRLCNKLWNAFKFVQSSIEKFNTTELYLNELIIDFKLKRQHVWILNKLNVCIELMDKGYEEYNFMSITQAIHSTFLYDFCDVYIEFCKDRRDYDVKVLSYVFLQIVRLFNPLMPFITEEIHYSLTGKIIKTYPGQFKISSDLNEKLIKEFESVIQLSKLVNKGVKIEIDDLTIFDDIKRLVRKSLHQNINFNSFKFDQSDALVKQMNEIFYKEI
ncbi:SYVC [Hepatospora eriocheir]|uniref:valine--tRNA ligase n=1 Tax=Hepatospora eriocheir TaxID=1081669 RepID=A0A1X0QGS6_9MICR|nr:SYVC [Hepatospora eriocheir]